MRHSFLKELFQQFKKKHCHIVLSEGEDDRVIAAAIYVAQESRTTITLLGRSEIILSKISHHKLSSAIKVVDPAQSEFIPAYSETYFSLRRHKGITREFARKAVTHPLNYAAIMVKENHAMGTIGGAVYTTADTLRAALHVIGRKPDTGHISSFFIMLPETEKTPIKSPVLFADCAMIVEPSAEQLAEIGLAAGHTAEKLLGTKPQVGFLSFSTAGSGNHPNVDKVKEALQIACLKKPNWIIPQELQFDAAIDPILRRKKAPNLEFEEHPNVFVFPNLEAGNIGYKIAERIGGMVAVGPVLQGLAKPANDLSRGCQVDDIIALIVITCLQAQTAND